MLSIIPPTHRTELDQLPVTEGVSTYIKGFCEVLCQQISEMLSCG
jgi:hypothetical protein